MVVKPHAFLKPDNMISKRFRRFKQEITIKDTMEMKMDK